MDRAELSVLSQIVVPPDYLDGMGHMNVMWYTHLFSKANRVLTAAAGLDQDYRQRSVAGTFGLKHLVTYLAEVHCGQKITLRGRLIARDAKRIHSMLFMTADERADKLCATAEWIVVHVDLTSRRSAPLPAVVALALDQALLKDTALVWAQGIGPMLKL